MKTGAVGFASFFGAFAAALFIGTLLGFDTFYRSGRIIAASLLISLACFAAARRKRQQTTRA